MYYPRVDFVDSFLGEFHQLLRFLRVFCILGLFLARKGLSKI